MSERGVLAAGGYQALDRVPVVSLTGIHHGEHIVDTRGPGAFQKDVEGGGVPVEGHEGDGGVVVPVGQKTVERLFIFVLPEQPHTFHIGRIQGGGVHRILEHSPAVEEEVEVDRPQLRVQFLSDP